MRVEFKNKALTNREKAQIKEILFECDEEFYPPLSQRKSPYQKELNVVTNASDGPIEYYNEMIKQDFILAYDCNEVVGFMTFKEEYLCEPLLEFGRSLYITTVCVKKSYRGKKLLSRFYDYIENVVTKELHCDHISTRTWSLNVKQLNSLEKRGYEKISVLKNDRGNNVDTIYFGLIKEI